MVLLISPKSQTDYNLIDNPYSFSVDAREKGYY